MVVFLFDSFFFSFFVFFSRHILSTGYGNSGRAKNTEKIWKERTDKEVT
jgi:hypothetical protein